MALVGEAVATIEVYGAKTLDRVSPLDLLAGLQARAGRARLTAGVLYAGGIAAVRAPSALSPLAGFVDLSRASESDARALPAARRSRRRGLASASGGPARDAAGPGRRAARRARASSPTRYTIVSEHQLGFVVVLGWAF